MCTKMKIKWTHCAQSTYRFVIHIITTIIYLNAMILFYYIISNANKLHLSFFTLSRRQRVGVQYIVRQCKRSDMQIAFLCRRQTKVLGDQEIKVVGHKPMLNINF